MGQHHAATRRRVLYLQVGDRSSHRGAGVRRAPDPVPRGGRRGPARGRAAKGWEVRDVAGDQAEAQPAPPEESAEGEDSESPVITPGQDPAAVLPVAEHRRSPRCSTRRVKPALYPGEVRSYRLRVHGPEDPARLQLADRVRRGAPVGRRLPEREAHRRRPRRLHAFRAARPRPAPRPAERARVKVDSRKNPRLLEGWWNWGGIVRPVHLVPVGRAHLRDLGTMSRVSCSGPARGVQGVAAARRRARAPPRPSDRPGAPGAPARARRPRDSALVPPRPPAAQAAARAAVDARPGPAAVVARPPAALLGAPHPARRRPGAAGRAPVSRAALDGGQGRPAVPQQPPGARCAAPRSTRTCRATAPR